VQEQKTYFYFPLQKQSKVQNSICSVNLNYVLLSLQNWPTPSKEITEKVPALMIQRRLMLATSLTFAELP